MKTSKQNRHKPLQSFTLSPEANVRLTEMARRLGTSRSALVDRLIRETDMPPEISEEGALP